MRKIYYLLIFSLLFGGCGQKEDEQQKQTPSVSIEHEQPKAESDISLKPIRFAELPNWFRDDMYQAFPAIKSSCEKIFKEKSEYLSNSELKIPTIAYQEACRGLLRSDINSSTELRYHLDKNFTPYAILDKGNPDGKFTSYYESTLAASRHQSAEYPYPIYGKPTDLIEVNVADFDDHLPAYKIYGRLNKDKNKLIPYLTREEIETTEIPAPVILWAKDLVDVNIMQIQGSAIARLENGDLVRLGFAAHNGRPFTGIGSILLSEGLIDKGHASMGEIRKWLKTHPQIAKQKLRLNKRYVFHRVADTSSPVGAHGVPLTEQRSLAVDRKYIPLGAILWLETTGPNHEKLEQLVVAQDTGGAIKGIVRGDFYWGSGDDDVLAKAGSMNAVGRYYILLPKTLETPK